MTETAVRAKDGRSHAHTGMTSHAHARKGPGPVNDEALRRLRNVEGQVRGLQKMVEEEKYCVDILTQISAVRAALNQVGLIVLKRHVEHCVVDAVRNPDAGAGQKIIDELMSVISKGQL